MRFTSTLKFQIVKRYKIKFLVIGLFSLFTASVILHFYPGKPSNEISFHGIPEEAERTLVQYSPDSSFKVIYDSVFHVWDIKSGEEINQFDLSACDSIFVGSVKYLAVHPTGNFMVIADQDGSISSWDTRKGNCMKASHQYGPDDFNLIEFTADGKFLFAIDYREATVDVLEWPDLNYLTTGYLGRYRNSFYWENRKGKLIFYFVEGNNHYEIEFPHLTNSGKPEFTKPKIVGKVKQN